jgi:cation transport regulator ChaC
MIPGTMTAWFVAAIPVLIMIFALAMERLEERLRRLAVRENAVQQTEVEEFLEAAREGQLRALARTGNGGTWSRFRRRRLAEPAPGNLASLFPAAPANGPRLHPM